MGQVCSFSIKRQQRSAVPIPFMPDPGARMREYQGTTAHLAGVRRTGETRGSSLRETRVIAGDPGGGSPQKADTRPLSPCGRGRKIMVLVRERQVIDFSGEVEVSGVEPGPLSCKIYDLADAKLMILLSPPPRGRGCAQRLASKIHPHFHPHPPPPCHTRSVLPLPDGSRTYRPGGRECPGPGVLTWRRSGFRRRRPSGFRWRHRLEAGPAQSGSRGRRWKASHRAGVRFLPAPHGAGETESPVRACGGHGGPEAARPGSVPEPAPKASLAVCPDRGRGNPGGGP
jgi:hypothetical protein